MAVSRRVASFVGAAGFALLSVTGSALADDKFSWGVSLTGTSDYVFRGISQTDNDPTVQGAVDVGYGMFYAGVWGSGLDFYGDNGDKANIELDYYAGITPTWGPLSFDFGVIYYDYPGYNPGSDPDLLELKAGVSGEIQKGLSAGATFYISPDYNDAEYEVYEGTMEYALPAFNVFSPSVSGLIGYVDNHGVDSFDYTYWNAGLSLAVEKLTFDFRYWDTDQSFAECESDTLCSEKFVFTATIALP